MIKIHKTKPTLENLQEEIDRLYEIIDMKVFNMNTGYLTERIELLEKQVDSLLKTLDKLEKKVYDTNRNAKRLARLKTVFKKGVRDDTVA